MEQKQPSVKNSNYRLGARLFSRAPQFVFER
jgi:hypothetical protein